MPFPSLYRSQERARDWSLAYAACYGAALGALAAALKARGPLAATAGSVAAAWPGKLAEIAIAAFAFAALCAAAAALRNFLLRRIP
jgi:hypothetical protein